MGLKRLSSRTLYPIDLAVYRDDRIWESQNLDHVAKVALSNLKLAQQKNLDVIQIRKILRKEWPRLSEQRRGRYIVAAINFIKAKSKSKMPPENYSSLRSDMIQVHGINPDSPWPTSSAKNTRKA